jgi:hypothetical protein
MRSKRNNLKAKLSLLLMIFLLILLMGSLFGCSQRNIFGTVSNPKLPSIPRPENLQYCENDSDCTITLHSENSCCLSCTGAVSNEGAKYLQEWYDMNCQNPKYSEDCIVFECCEVNDVKCINNTCTVISECTARGPLAENKSNNDLFKKIFNSTFFDDLNKSSVCLKGYLRYFGRPYFCFPETCLLIEGNQMIGDVGFPRFGDCAWASFEKKIDRCNVYEKKEKDYCILAYYSTVLDTLDCNLLNDRELFRMCYDVKNSKNKTEELSCNIDEDCVLTLSEENSCCPVRANLMNKKTEELQSIWREENCPPQELDQISKKLEQKEITIETIPKKWVSCIIGSGMFTVHLPNEPTIPYCNEDICRLK